MPVTFLDRSKMKKIGDRVQKRMTGFDKLGLTIMVGNMRWTENEGTITLHVAVNNPSGKRSDKEGDTFRTYAEMLGYKPDLIGVEWKVPIRRKIHVCTVVGYKPRATKAPFIIKTEDDKRYVFTDAQLRSALLQNKLGRYITANR